MEHARLWILLAALLGGTGVALGAFGAHGLPKYFASQNLSGEELAKRAANWETAARYHMYHALALLAVAWLATTPARVPANIAGWMFVAGIAIFSGCLYALVLSGVKVLGAIVPLGGLSLIAGWVALLIGGLRLR